MWRGLVHVEVGGEYPKLGIAFLKTTHVLAQQHRRKLAVLASGAHILRVAHLQDDFMERLFLLAGAYLFVVVLDLPVRPGLLVIVPLEGIVEQFMVHRLDILVAVVYIEVGAFWVGVLGVELTAIVAHRSMPHHYADCPFQVVSFLRPQPGFCYSCQE